MAIDGGITLHHFSSWTNVALLSLPAATAFSIAREGLFRCLYSTSTLLMSCTTGILFNDYDSFGGEVGEGDEHCSGGLQGLSALYLVLVLGGVFIECLAIHDSLVCVSVIRPGHIPSILHAHTDYLTFQVPTA